MNSKQKGARGEREWAAFCREQGFDCRRTAQYCGNTGNAADVVGIPGIHFEVKRVERLNISDAMFQAKHDAAEAGLNEIPVVPHRKNNEEWLVTMRAEDWFAFCREWVFNNGSS